MEYNITEDSDVRIDDSNTKASNSAETFQKFIYDLFEKNGILYDLRAYLRGHIVNVLKSADTGDPLTCQKNFTQRLELTFQALNILIAEYLLSLEFSYSLSVFISEIPLANMVFDFAKMLLHTSDSSYPELRFKDNDIWRILNYLGLKCDSEHASSILEWYNKKEKLPLLLCIFKCVSMYQDPNWIEDNLDNVSLESLSSSNKSTKTLKDVITNSKKSFGKCKHYRGCKICRSRLRRLKDKWRLKKTRLAQSTKMFNDNPINVEKIVKNVGVVEDKLLKEMFENVKSVYEAEVEMFKEEEQNKVKRSIASHALLLQQKQDELEKELKAREEQLEQRIQEKKRFVWGLAKTLREQHEKIEGALVLVQRETDKLTDKENSIKCQLKDAENMLKKKGKEIREQITTELIILEQNLQSMKREREVIDNEKVELEKLKQLINENSKVKTDETMEKQYNLLRTELNIFKEYLGSKDRKIVIERGTSTEVGLLNNENFVFERYEDVRVKPNQVVNDLKKQKNVNFSQSNIEDMYGAIMQDRSNTSVVSNSGRCDHSRELIQQLKDENDRLKEFARQQGLHIESLSRTSPSHRPCTAPPTAPVSTHAAPTSPSSSAAAVGNGAGEELRMFPEVRGPLLVPGDVLPFIGVLGDSRAHSRRHLINQWKKLRQRSANRHRSPARPLADASEPSVSKPDSVIANQIYVMGTTQHHEREEASTSDVAKPKERSSKATSRDIKKDSRDNIKLSLMRERSSNSILREAKMRLRKLEIEAEAVEKSYMNFRKKRELKDGNQSVDPIRNVIDMTSRPTSPGSREEKLIKRDFEKFLRDYDIGKLRFNNKNTAIERVNPIPNFANVNDITQLDYLETPLAEFRKLYQTQDPNKNINEQIPKPPSSHSHSDDMKRTKREAYELKILEHNIDIMYNNLQSPSCLSVSLLQEKKKTEKNRSENTEPIIVPTSSKGIEDLKDEASSYNIPQREESITDLLKENVNPKNIPVKSTDNTNLLQVEIDNEADNIEATDSKKDLLIIVESTIDNRFLSASDIAVEEISPEINIVLSPKNNSKDNSFPEASSLGSIKKTDNLINDIYHVKDKDASSVDIELQLGTQKDTSLSERDGEKDTIAEYPDDFSADVDNYNSPSECGNNSPISVLKSSEDNFWDS